MKNNNFEIISGFKFAEIADVVFSGVFLKSQVSELNLKDNVDNQIGDLEYIFVRKKKFELKENQIIFCKTEYIKELFKILDKQCKFKNIKLITHQSDLKITKKIYLSKPNCISKWYSINVDYDAKDLIPIPIGIANFHSKNLNEKIFTNGNQKNNYYSEKNELLYVNFNPNTNFGHRKALYPYFHQMNWVNTDLASLKHEQYKSKMSNHSFTLAPWGNGIDTHRFWETLYSGSIPITKKHLIYTSFTTLPKILVEDYEVINHKFLIDKLQDLIKNKENYNLEELDFKYWKNIIQNKTSDLNEFNSQILINHHSRLYRNIADFKHVLKSKLKVFNRSRRLIYRVFKV
tara:strand:+ start:8010 stop:9047 length:1038 start_codon:yes stop_codon:yes gene_type:complete